MNRYLLGIDIGTTFTKGVLIDMQGHTLAVTSREATLRSEKPTWAEEDPQQWWCNTCEVIRELLQTADADPSTVAAIGVSGMVPAMILLDERGEPLRRSIQQNDARTSEEIHELKARYDEDRFFRLTGGSINQQVVAPKARWLSKHEPDVMRKLHTLLGSYDYINYKLTGERAVEHNWALESGLYDIRGERWSEELVQLAGLTLSQLPQVRRSHEILGGVSNQASRATGLREGTPVVAGVADHVASAFATTACEDGDLVIKFGGAGDILYSLDKLVTDPRLFIDYHSIPGKYYLNGCMATSGSLVKWYVQQFCSEDEIEARKQEMSVYELLDRKATELPPGGEGLVVLPYFLGEKTPLHDPYARGSFLGLALHHTRYHLFRAVLEAVVYGFQHHVDILAEKGLEVKRVLASDGGARSDLWLQIAADVLQRPVHRVAQHPGSSLGAAFTAGVGVGLFQQWEQVEGYVQLSKTFHPNARNANTYSTLYRVYRKAYERLKDLYPSLLEA